MTIVPALRIALLCAILASLQLRAVEVPAAFTLTPSRPDSDQANRKVAVPFITSYDQALDLAQKENKPLFIFYTASWCGSCQRMKQEIFAHPYVVRALKAYIPLQVDIDASPDRERVEQFREGTGVPSCSVVSLTPEPRRINVLHFVRVEQFLARLRNPVAAPVKGAQNEQAYLAQLARYHLETRNLPEAVDTIVELAKYARDGAQADIDDAIDACIELAHSMHNWPQLLQATEKLRDLPASPAARIRVAMHQSFAQCMITNTRDEALDEYINTLIELTGSGHGPTVTNKASYELQKLIEYAHDRLFAGLSDPNHYVRDRCNVVLSSASDGAVVSRLKRMLVDHTLPFDTRLQVIDAIEESRNRVYVEDLINFVRNAEHDSELRAGCLAALAGIYQTVIPENPAVLLAIVNQAMEDPDVDVRAQALGLQFRVDGKWDMDRVIKLTWDTREPSRHTVFSYESSMYSHTNSRVADIACMVYLKHYRLKATERKTGESPVQPYSEQFRAFLRLWHSELRSK